MSIHFKNMQNVQGNLKKYPTQMKKNIRQSMNGEGFAIVQTNIKSRMPISSKGKVHARTGNSVRRMALKSKNKNQIGFYATLYKKFWYMQFPDEGTKYQRPQKFMSKGAKASERPIQALVNKAIKQTKL